MGSSLRLGHRAWLLKVVLVLAVCFAGLVTAGVVSGAGLATFSGSTDTTATTTDGTTTTDTTEPTETETTETEAPASAPPCAATGDETLAADRAAYLPGARALLSGTGFGQDCAVFLQVTLPDETTETHALDTAGDGTLGFTYPLPSPAVPGDYVIDAVGADAAVLASVTFEGLSPDLGAPSIWTDRGDYMPGEIFELRGAGWLPGEAVSVFVNDDDGETWNHTAVVAADATGTFMHEFQLPDWFVAVYTVTATGPLSGVAATSFTDAVAFGGCVPVGSTITVNTTVDEFNTGATCSLREATRTANLDSAADTIVLTNTTYLLTRSGAANNDTATGDLDIDDPVSIAGNGAVIRAGTTTANGIDRVFHVLSNGNLTLTNATVELGRLSSTVNEEGAGIRTEGRPLTLAGVVLRNNTNQGNDRDGGGIHSSGATVSIQTSTISGNSTLGEGGGVYASGGTLNLTSSTVSGNTAPSGSGPRDGGGIWTTANGTWTNVTLTNNSAAGTGGGTRIDGGTTTVINATVSHNTAGTGGGIARTSGTVNLRNTIVSNNTVGVNADANCSGSIGNTGNNLDSAATCGFGASQSNLNPGLGNLMNNGGPTETRSIGSGSPAVDTGFSSAPAPATDQRGLGRTDGPDGDAIAQYDVGAFEFQASANATPSVAYVAPAASATEGSTVTYNFAITDTDAVDTFTFVATYPKCGTGGVPLGSPSIDNLARTGAFQCSFPDGAASPTVEVRVKDAASAESNTASQGVTVSNVQPSIAISGAASVNEGSIYTLTLGTVTDPGQDTVTSYVVHWGDGATDTYGSAGAKTHTYADGTVTRSVTADLVDDDGTHLNRANALSVQVANVAPTVTLAAGNTYTWPESATAERTFDYTASDPAGAADPLTMTIDCGTGGVYVAGSDNGSSFKCRFPDGPATPTVSLSANDGDGGTGSDSEGVTVTNLAPTVTLAAGNTYTWPESATAARTFDYTASDPAGAADPLAMTIDCGTGGVYVAGSDNGSSFQCRFPDGPASPTVSVSANDGDGGTDSDTHAVQVTNVAPTVTLAATNTYTWPESASAERTFDYTASDPAGAADPLTMTIDCGTGGVYVAGSDNGTSFQCRFPDGPATPTVSVSGNDGDGGIGSDNEGVTVNNVAPTVTLAAGNTYTWPESQTAARTFDYTATDPAGAADPLTKTIDCGAGGVYVAGSDNGTSFQCRFPDGPASPTVSVSANDGDSGIGSDGHAVSVTNVAPTVTLAATNTYTWPESPTAARTFDYTATDPAGAADPLTVTVACGIGGNYVAGSDNGSSFQCRFPDGPATPNVSVSANDGDGGIGSDDHAVQVNNVAPTVTLAAGNTYTWPESATAERTFDYTASDPAGAADPLTMTIDCGTGGVYVAGSDNGSSFKCRFPDGPATPTVSLSANDGDGGTGSDSEGVTVTNLAPTVTLAAGNTYTWPESATAARTFDYTASDPAGAADPLAMTIDCGTGGVYVAGSDNGSSFQCRFPDGPASPTVSVSANDGDGGTDSDTHAVQVTNVAPTVTLAATNTYTWPESASAERTFDYTASDPAGAADPLTMTIDCGTGGVYVAGSDNGSSFQCRFPDGPATPTVSVSGNDGDGGIGSDNEGVTVNNVAPTVTLAAGNTYTWPESQTAARTFDYTATDPAGAADPLTKTIDCGAGGVYVAGSDNGTSFQCRFPDGPASPTVSVSANDGDSGIGSDGHAVQVTNVAPSVTPPANQSANEGAAKTYDLGSFGDPGDDGPWRVTVSWGDGSADNVLTQTTPGPITDQAHTYADDGTYTVTITVDEENGVGESGSATFQATVANVTPAVAKPTLQPALVGCQSTVTMSGISFTDPGDDDPWTVDIDWGDLSPHTTFTANMPGAQPNQNHTYATAGGPFTATVSVTDDHATGSNTSTAPVTVYRYSVEFRPPVEGSSTGHVVDNRMKNGRVVPVKVKIRDLCAGAELTDPNAAVTVAVTKASGTPGVDDPVAEYADAGASSDGTNKFRWSTEHWIYNLDSKALGFVVGNRYRVDVYVNGVRATVATWAILDPYK